MQKHFLHATLLAIVAMMMFALPQHAQAQTKEAYAVKSTDGKTLTFYYDTQKATRPGTKWGIEEKHKESSTPAWAGIDGTPNRTITQAVIDPSFKEFRPKTTAEWFNQLQALTQITGLEHLNTSEVTDMYAMFYGCIVLPQLDVSKFDTKNVTNMSRMFNDCKALTQLDVSKFDTKNVTNMYRMFTKCAALTRLDVSNFSTANVTDMSLMFAGCAALIQLDVSKFDTKNVTRMNWMFGECAALTRLDVSKFNTQNVTHMSSMFDGCKALTQLDVSNFNTKNVIEMGFMFSYCTALTTIYCNNTWTCGKSNYMFAGCPKLKGAVSYAPDKIDATMANPNTGYFTKKGAAGITQTGHAATVKAIYSADGRQLKALQPGVNIMKMSDGTTRKVVKK